ncbi:hypothetical protein LCGC14_0580080 [marine sediment metagenome]|uniref:DUF2958 domain-containing protein n=1 Tax=marine sediment metagenome TaxID=412755 RepID=A0A0F9U304_9ZZZZ
MMLLTKENRKTLSPIGSQDGEKDPIIQVKFFDPTGSFTWFAYEGQPVLDENGAEIDFEFFGLVTSSMCPDGELGCFRLNELKTCKQGVRGLQSLPIERDKWFTPKPLSKITTMS